MANMDDYILLSQPICDFLHTLGANDVYEVALDEGGTVLIPAIKECILDVDVENAVMRVHLLEGLLDLQ